MIRSLSQFFIKHPIGQGISLFLITSLLTYGYSKYNDTAFWVLLQYKLSMPIWLIISIIILIWILKIFYHQRGKRNLYTYKKQKHDLDLVIKLEHILVNESGNWVAFLANGSRNSFLHSDSELSWIQNFRNFFSYRDNHFYNENLEISYKNFYSSLTLFQSKLKNQRCSETYDSQIRYKLPQSRLRNSLEILFDMQDSANEVINCYRDFFHDAQQLFPSQDFSIADNDSV